MGSDLSDAQCREIATMSQANHIWINAFTIIQPSDETLLGIGQMVVDMLKQKDNLMPARADHENEMAKLTPTLYLRVNAS